MPAYRLEDISDPILRALISRQMADEDARRKAYPCMRPSPCGKPIEPVVFENKKKPNAKAKLNDIYDSKWELEYHQYLQTQGKTALCHVIKFQLANGCWYMPDFLVVGDCGKLELHEVKGHWREAAKVRFKVARDKFPWFVWRVVRKEKGSWIEEEV